MKRSNDPGEAPTAETTCWLTEDPKIQKTRREGERGEKRGLLKQPNIKREESSTPTRDQGNLKQRVEKIGALINSVRILMVKNPDEKKEGEKSLLLAFSKRGEMKERERERRHSKRLHGKKSLSLPKSSCIRNRN